MGESRAVWFDAQKVMDSLPPDIACRQLKLDSPFGRQGMLSHEERAILKSMTLGSDGIELPIAADFVELAAIVSLIRQGRTTAASKRFAGSPAG